MNVIVIGGGASGLMAALTAARNGHAVTLLERQSRVGRKLLSTGNGRCNLTNLHVAPVHYHGLSPDFVRPALDAFDTGAALAFFHGLGLLTVAEDSGRVYPYSGQAGSVLDVLRFAADAAGVITRTAKIRPAAFISPPWCCATRRCCLHCRSGNTAAAAPRSSRPPCCSMPAFSGNCAKRLSGAS